MVSSKRDGGTMVWSEGTGGKESGTSVSAGREPSAELLTATGQPDCSGLSLPGRFGVSSIPVLRGDRGQRATSERVGRPG